MDGFDSQMIFGMRIRAAGRGRMILCDLLMIDLRGKNIEHSAFDEAWSIKGFRNAESKVSVRVDLPETSYFLGDLHLVVHPKQLVFILSYSKSAVQEHIYDCILLFLKKNMHLLQVPHP